MCVHVGEFCSATTQAVHVWVRCESLGGMQRGKGESVAEATVVMAVAAVVVGVYQLCVSLH
jgi:hypothetical protein